MPYEDFFDVNLEFTDKELEQLDKKIEKKSKEIERKQKKLQKKGGIFVQSSDKKTLPILDALDETSNDALGQKETVSPIYGGQTQNLPRGKTPKDIEHKRDKLKSFLQSDLGTGKASQAISLISNPMGFILSAAAPLMAAMFAIGLAQQVWQFLSQRGGLASIWFEDQIETRFDKFRDLILQAEIKAGFTQIIQVFKDGTWKTT